MEYERILHSTEESIEEIVPEYLSTVELAQNHLGNMISRQYELLHQAQPRQRVVYEQIIQGLSKLQNLLNEGGEVSEYTLKTIQQNWEGKRDVLYDSNAERIILENLINKYFQINTDVFGLQTDSNEMRSGENKEDSNLSELSKEYINNLLQILERVGNKEGDVLINLEYMRGQHNIETVRGYSYTIIELKDKEIFLAESFVKGNAMYVIDKRKIPNDITNPKEYILTRSKDALNTLEYTIRYEHREGYVDLIVNKIQEIIASRDTQEEDVKHLQFETEYTQESEDWTVRRWGELVMFLETYNRRPQRNTQNPLEQSLAITLNNYLSSGAKRGLDTEMEKKLQSIIESFNQREEQRWQEVIRFIQEHKRRPSDRADDSRERTLAVLLNRYTSGGGKRGLTPEKEDEIKQLIAEFGKRNRKSKSL